MTIGQRIAQKRKELGLSQEALGEELGVSRQSIYKWESDSALPEIDKFIALSRLFGVSVGWLLGQEDTEPPKNTAADPEGSGELSEAQLKMVEEIVDRYLAAQPQSKMRRRWPMVLAVLAIFLAGVNLFSRLDRLNNQYNNLQSSVSNVTHSVNSQINGISNRVEELLKAQNHLTAEYSTVLTACDYARNTATFSLRAVPKTYTQGMTAVFLADSGDGPAEFPAQAAPGGAFTGEATVPLTDTISLSVVFTAADATRSTQLLDEYQYLYSESVPDLSLHEDLWHTDLTPENIFSIPASNHAPVGYVYFRYPEPSETEAEIESIRIGLFKNLELVCWAEPCDIPDTFHGFEEYTFYSMPEFRLPLTEEDIIGYAAVITDQYGRTFVSPGGFYCMDEDGRLSHTNGSPDILKADKATGQLRNPSNWVFE